MRHLYLIGFMGSGKTTIAKRLSNKLKMDYLDLDVFVEKIQNRKIRDIFAEEGEEAFRSYETNALQSIGHTPIIATGGGIIEREENISMMKNTGLIIFLHASYETIAKRLRNDQSRPLWRDKDKSKKLYERRLPIYQDIADHIIECDSQTIREIVDEIIRISKYKGFFKGENYT